MRKFAAAKINPKQKTMKKLLLTIAVATAAGCVANAITVQDICKKYNYTGEVVEETGTYETSQASKPL